MQTIKLKYKVSEEDKNLLFEYIRQYNSCLHFMYNRLIDNSDITEKEMRSLTINNIPLLNYYLIQCSIKESFQIKASTDEDKRIIFGGKDNFIKRCQGKISKEEFLKKRMRPLYSIGDKEHTNRLFCFDDINTIIFKPNRKTHIKLDIFCNFHKGYRKIINKLFDCQLHKTIGMTFKVDMDYVYISFDETILKEKETKKIENRVFSIDLNPNYVGWSVVDWKSSSEFNVVSSGVISIKSLNDKHFALKKSKKNPDGLSSDHPKRTHLNNKREHEVFEISKNLIDKALYYRCSLFAVEDLTIKPSDKKKGSKFNSLCNNLWNRDKMVNNLKKRCIIYGLKLFEIQPNYSSFIGNFLFRDLNLPDMVLASIEISRRCYEFYNQYVIKSKEIRKNIIQPEINEFYDRYIKSLEEFGVTGEFKDFKDVYSFFKSSKMMYRVSLDSLNPKFFSLNTRKSYVGQCYFCYF